MVLTVACANQKGGVGKTTTVVNLATSLALAGKRVLVVDLDPQGNATSGLGIDRSVLERTTYDVLVDGSSLDAVATATQIPGLDVAPSAIALAGAELELVPLDQRERRLEVAISSSSVPYDLILVDCPPSLGLLTINALTAAHGILIPVQCEYYALEGLTQLIATFHLVRDHLNPSLELEGALLTMADGRTNLSADVAAEVRRHLGSAVYRTVIPRSVRLSEAPSHGVPIALYSPDSKGATAYAEFAREFLERAGERLGTGASSGEGPMGAVMGRRAGSADDERPAASRSAASGPGPDQMISLAGAHQ